MKKSILILFVLLSQVCMGQLSSVISSSEEMAKYKNGTLTTKSSISLPHKGSYIDASKSLTMNPSAIDSNAIKRCKERGHIVGAGLSGSTLMYCSDYVIDTDSTSILVHPACNSIWYTCGRCRQQVSEPGKETREIIWKKKLKK